MKKRFRYIRTMREATYSIEVEPKLRTKSYDGIKFKQWEEPWDWCGWLFRGKQMRNWKEFRKTQHK